MSIVSRLSLLPLLVLTVTVAANAQSRVPDAAFNGRDVTYEISAGSQLRVGDRLTDRLVYTVWERTTVKGTGSCTQGACPVTFNGQEVYARRSRLSITTSDRPAAGGRPAQPSDRPTAADQSRKDDRYPSGWSRLQRGDSSERVRELQELLIREGAKDLKVDGRYGRTTETAVRDLQRRKQLQVDGVAGFATLRALGV